MYLEKPKQSIIWDRWWYVLMVRSADQYVIILMIVFSSSSRIFSSCIFAMKLLLIYLLSFNSAH